MPCNQTILNLTLSTLITANHVLDFYGLVDGFGHISVRDPCNSSLFYMTGFPPPALIQSPADIDHFTTGDAIPVGSSPGELSPYSERFIHAGVLATIPEAISVVHSHSQDVVAQSISDVPLKAAWHVAGFLGSRVPLFEIENFYNSTQDHNLLVNTPQLGSALASILLQDPTESSKVVLQRGHGFTTWGTGIEQAVYRAMYTQSNARIQRKAMSIAADQFGNASGVRYLSSKEIIDCDVASDGNWVKSWPLWAAQVAVNPLYKNLLVS